tara:strand:+ start:4035 stop:4298 length:264 start_codon:yes stop_codon:yes gene_type:complete
MEIEKLALEVFNNKESYSNQDYITIMNCLMESYHKQKGMLPIYEVGKTALDEESDEEEDQDDIAYTNYDSEEEEEHSGYLGDYIESY